MSIVTWLVAKHAVPAAKNFDTNSIPLTIDRYVSIAHDMTQLSTKTVEALVNGTAVTGMALVSFVYRNFEKITWWLTDFFFFNGPNMFIGRSSSREANESKQAAFNDGFSCPSYCKTGSQTQWCTYRWQNEASNTLVSVYNKVFSCLCDQRGHDKARSTECLHVMTWVRYSVVPFPFWPVWPKLHLYCMNKRTPACIQCSELPYNWGNSPP